MTQHDLDATAIQCWSSLQQNYGVNCCTIMSMMSEKLMPSACEVDIAGTVAMYALQLASGKPSALVDWNNNYGDDPDKCVFFHCGNWAKAFLPDIDDSPPRRSSARRSARRTPTAPSPAARRRARDVRARVDRRSRRRDPGLRRRGTRSPTIRCKPSARAPSCEVPELQQLMQFICRNGFEHHAAMNASASAGVLVEAFGSISVGRVPTSAGAARLRLDPDEADSAHIR